MSHYIKVSLSLLDRKSRFLVKSFAVARLLLSFLDTFGVVLIGLLLAKSTSQITENKDSHQLGFLNVNGTFSKFTLLQIACLALILFTLKSLLSALFTKIMLNALASAEAKAATRAFENILSHRNLQLSSISSQDLIFALNTSATNAINGILATTVTILSETMLLISISVLFALINFKIAIGIFIYFSVIGYATNKIIGPRMQRAGKKFAESSPAAAKTLNDSVVAYREILTLGKEEEFLSKFAKGRLSVAKSTAYSMFYSGVPRYIVETALMIGTLLLSAIVLNNGSPTEAVGTLGIFLTGSVRIMASMLPLQAAVNSLKDLAAKSQPFFDLAWPAFVKSDSKNHLADSSSKISKPISISLDKVSFRYPGSYEFAVSNISFNIKPGEYVALIGPSGSGKSTIADLLIKLIEPSSGSVTYTNLNQSEAKLGYVPQSPGIVSGNILENVTLNVASGNFDQNQLNESLQLAHLENLVKSLKHGVGTDLGAHSDGLSGGQMQRIGLARALYAQPGLLVLDEATSALDAETESAVAESLISLKGACTLVVIAHRLSTVQNADCVYVIDKGQIVDSGKFNDLAKTNKLVARYVELSQLNID